MNYGALVRKGDTLKCACGQQAVVSAARQLPAGWIAKAEPVKDFTDQITYISQIVFVCPQCARAELERLNP